jgi:hypothetical protein
MTGCWPVTVLTRAGKFAGRNGVIHSGRAVQVGLRSENAADI